jgi:hypothetical protein
MRLSRNVREEKKLGYWMENWKKPAGIGEHISRM